MRASGPNVQPRDVMGAVAFPSHPIAPPKAALEAALARAGFPRQTPHVVVRVPNVKLQEEYHCFLPEDPGQGTLARMEYSRASNGIIPG